MLGGLMLEGGKLSDVAQITAAMIVFGGTLGAVMVSTPMYVLMGSVRSMKSAFAEEQSDPTVAIDEIIRYASKARKNGLVSLEGDASSIKDPFLSKALTLAVDGTDLQEIRKMMELEITVYEQKKEAEAKVFEAAGGYAPTIGIIGAVLGLIQVMKEIADVDKVGRGIAVAFVATVYGVAAANILFLPMANKIKARIHEQVQMRELVLEGVIGIVEGLNPKLIRSKLLAYAQAGEGAPKKTKGAKAGEKSAADAGAAAPARV